MAERFQVLRCCFCQTFQVQQIKKSKKWNCKMCGEKQSVLKVFGQGSGLDCRCHVQKLNLLQGEVEQASGNMLRHMEEPEEREDENTAVGLEEDLGWQEQKVGLTSRWTKYLDKGCGNHEKKEKVEEEMVLTEKQTYHSKRNRAKNPRKRTKTGLYPTDVRGPDQKRVDGLAKNIRCFEGVRTSATADTKNCGDLICESLIAPVTEEPFLHGKNKESASRGAPISKWEKFLLSDECANSSGMTTPVQEILKTPVKTPASDGIASFIGITPSNWGSEPKQNASILLDQVSDTEHVEITSICTGRSRETPVLASSLNLFNRQSEEPASVPSLSPPAVSNVKNFYRSLFSTGEDFDDSL